MNIKVLGRPEAAPGAHADVRVPLVMARRPGALPPLPDQLGTLELGHERAEGPQLAALAGTSPCADSWISAGPQHQGSTGLLCWRHNTDWLYGSLQVDAAPGELASNVQQAYADLFAAMRQTGFIHPVRLWNYVPRINADEGGLERYRHFNAGRQQAFLAAGQAAFEGSPAACALGTHGGPVCVRVLASRHPARPIENPRQVSAYHYPTSYGPRSPSFSRAALVEAGAGQLMLLISGTASIVGHETLHRDDAEAQARESLANIAAVVAAANRRLGREAFANASGHYRVYVRHAAQLPQIRQALQAAGLPADALYVAADICRADLLLEIEATLTAASAGSSR